MRWEHWIYTVPLRLRSVFRRTQVEQELDDEVRFHLEREAAEARARGSSPDEAREAARRALLGIEQRKEECRDARRVSAVDELRRNLGFAVRRMKRTPGLSGAAVLTLGLGIAATTTVFTAVNRLVLRPLPVEASRRLVSLNHGQAVTFSYPDYRDFRDRNDVFAGLVAYRVAPMNVSTGRTAGVRVWGYEVTGNYFDLLGVRPLLGRLLRPDDDVRPGGHPVVVLSYDCWQRRFLGDAGAVGREVKINGLPYTVLGVTPRVFRGTELILNPDLWVPMSMAAQVEPGATWLDERSTTNVWMLGRLKDGVSREQAEAAANRIAGQLALEYPSTHAGMTIQLSPPGLIGNALRGPVTALTAVLMGIAGLVLLLACFNLAGMMVASATDRRTEIAVRLALGASRSQLIRQLLTESLLLSAAGGMAGLLAAAGVAAGLSAWRPPFDVPIDTSLALDGSVVLVAIASALFATVLFGLLPALQTARPDVVAASKNAVVTNVRRRWHVRDLLVAAQIALSVMLLVPSLLTVRGLQRALDLDLGFDPRHAVSASFDLSLDGYDEERGRAFRRELLERVAALPGVSATGLISNMPLRLGSSVDHVSIVGRANPGRDERTAAALYSVSPGYFAAAGTRLLAGRPIDARDRTGSAPVAVVNETFVRQQIGNGQPLGEHLRLGRPPAGEPIEIVGVVQNGKYQSLGEEPTPAVFFAMAQRYTGWTTLVARSSLAPRQALQQIRVATLDLDPTLTLFNVGTLEDQLALPLLPARITAAVLGVFGVLALALSASGVFALVTHAVSQRTREIGIRMALGARARDILGVVLGRVLVLWAVGALLGSSLALGGSRVMSAVLYDVSPRDPTVYLSGLLLMGAVAALACGYPAMRAMRINPVETVRQE